MFIPVSAIDDTCLVFLRKDTRRHATLHRAAPLVKGRGGGPARAESDGSHAGEGLMVRMAKRIGGNGHIKECRDAKRLGKERTTAGFSSASPPSGKES